MNLDSKIYIVGHRALTFLPNIMSKSRMLLTGGGFTLLTPSGVEQKARMTVEFLHIKAQGYERLRTEIEELKREAKKEISPGNTDE